MIKLVFTWCGLVWILHASTSYKEALVLARQGAYKEALSAFSLLYTKNPSSQKILHDYITVLAWAKQDQKALFLAQRVNYQTIPSYLLQNIAKSARNIQAYRLAAKLYILGIYRFSDEMVYYLGLAWTLHDMGKEIYALKVLAFATEKFEKEPSFLLAKAKILESQKRYFEAMASYEKILSKDSGNEEALYALVGVLRKLKMPFAAKRYVAKNPSLFDKETLLAIESDEVAFRLRWEMEGLRSQKGDDKSIDRLDEVLKDLGKQPPTLSQKRQFRNATFDKIVALDQKGAYQQAILLYESVKKESQTLPSYLVLAVAHSYLKSGLAYKAQKMLEEALVQYPDNFEIKELLFFAYSDCYQMDKALKFAAKVDATEPLYRWDKAHRSKIRNTQKERSYLLKILSYEYSGYLQKAKEMLQKALQKAPFNSRYRLELGRVYMQQGLYHKAKENYAILLANDPFDFDVYEAKFTLALVQKDYEEAKRILDVMYRRFASRSYQITLLERRYKEAKRGYFHIGALYAKDPYASHLQSDYGYEVEAVYYTPLLKKHWRGIVYTNLLYSRYYETMLDNRRMGIGVSYFSPKLKVSVKVGYNATAIETLTPSLDLSYRVNDRLTLEGGVAFFAQETPSRAIMYGIRSDRLYAKGFYRLEDRFMGSLAYEAIHFSDGNIQQSWQMVLEKRLIQKSYYRLLGSLYAGMGESSQPSQPYYTPQKERYLSLEAKNIWNLYSMHRFSLDQIVAFGFGKHWERGYDSHLTGFLELSQMWEFPTFACEVGFLRKRASYDGEVEYNNLYYLNLNGRL